MSFTAVVVSLLLTENGVQLNAKGEGLLASGHPNEALTLFRRAVEADPRLASAFFNEALAMVNLRHKTNVRVQPTKKDVLDAAETALQLDPRLRQRAESELPAVRSTFRGQRLLGRTIEKDTPLILQGITWKSRSDTRLDFLSDGTVRYWTHPNIVELAPRPAGRWVVEQHRVSVTLEGRSHDGSLDTDGVLTLEGLGRFFDW